MIREIRKRKNRKRENNGIRKIKLIIKRIRRKIEN